MSIATEQGICTGRNGTVSIGAIELFKIDDEGTLFRIDCYSKKRGTLLNAGMSFDRACATELHKELGRLLQ
jgi:hypothetical protein